MLTSLVLKNIQKKFTRNLLTLSSIIISITALAIFLGLNNGMKTASFSELEKQNPLDIIAVRPQAKSPGLFSIASTKNTKKLDQNAINEIKKIPGIKTIHKETQFNSFASIEVDLLGFMMITDTLVFGVPKELIESDLKDASTWDNQSEPYPVILPRELLDMYNYLIATPQGLPTIGEKNMLGKEIILYPNFSNFFPGATEQNKTIKLKVEGFSDKVNLIGVTLPYDLVEKLNTDFMGKQSSSYIELFVETDSPEITQRVAQEIEKLEFATDYYQKNLKDIQAKLSYLSVSLGTISLIILILSALTIVSNFLAAITDRRREIGLFRALGATEFHIKKIILFEAALLGLFGSALGLILGKILSHFLDNYLLTKISTFNFSPTSIFSLPISHMIAIVIFGILISILSAYLPATKAAKLNPFQALK